MADEKQVIYFTWTNVDFSILDILVRNVEASEMDQIRCDLFELKKELLKLKQEHRVNVDRVIDEGEGEQEPAIRAKDRGRFTGKSQN